MCLLKAGLLTREQFAARGAVLYDVICNVFTFTVFLFFFFFFGSRARKTDRCELYGTRHRSSRKMHAVSSVELSSGTTDVLAQTFISCRYSVYARNFVARDSARAFRHVRRTERNRDPCETYQPMWNLSTLTDPHASDGPDGLSPKQR